MKYLFVHQNFPGQYLHIARHLAAQGTHDILFLTENTKDSLPGVRKFIHKRPRPTPQATHPDAYDFDLAATRATEVTRAAQKLKSLGFVPDIVIGHHGWGELLNMQDVFPDTPVLGYYEFFYRQHGFDIGFDPEFSFPNRDFSRIRGKNTINLMALTNPGFGQTPTEFQLSTYPDWAHARIRLLREGVPLDICKPNPALSKRQVTLGGYKIAPGDKLVTYVARDLEPYRGFHSMMRALPKILDSRRDARVIMVGGDGVSYGAKLAQGTWRQHMLDQLSGRLDLSRVHFVGKLAYESYVKLLQRSDAHVYLTYPFVTSWSLREALATGCALVGSDTAPVREFVQHRKTGLLADMLKPEEISDAVLELLENQTIAAKLRRNARAWAEKNLNMNSYLANYEKLIDDLIEGRIDWR
jgi:glycosyltransferase involved in cell wall biosynthesis